MELSNKNIDIYRRTRTSWQNLSKQDFRMSAFLENVNGIEVTLCWGLSGNALQTVSMDTKELSSSLTLYPSLTNQLH